MGVLEIIQVMNKMIDQTKYIMRRKKVINVEKNVVIIDKT